MCDSQLLEMPRRSGQENNSWPKKNSFLHRQTFDVCFHALKNWRLLVWQAQLQQTFANARSNMLQIAARHGRKQMVLNLVIEIKNYSLQKQTTLMYHLQTDSTWHPVHNRSSSNVSRGERSLLQKWHAICAGRNSVLGIMCAENKQCSEQTLEIVFSF